MVNEKNDEVLSRKLLEICQFDEKRRIESNHSTRKILQPSRQQRRANSTFQRYTFRNAHQ